MNLIRTFPLAAALVPGLVLAALAGAQEPEMRRVAPGAQSQRQPPTPEELVAQREAKMASSFLEKADWATGYDKARERAKKEEKLIFTYFGRSFAP